eukprot:PhM_4_TR14370/c0_g1_i1/m.98117
MMNSSTSSSLFLFPSSASPIPRRTTSTSNKNSRGLHRDDDDDDDPTLSSPTPWFSALKDFGAASSSASKKQQQQKNKNKKASSSLSSAMASLLPPRRTSANTTTTSARSADRGLSASRVHRELSPCTQRLFNDAADRTRRLRQMQEDQQLEAARERQSRKTPGTEQLVRNKRLQELEEVFASNNTNGEMCYSQFKAALQSLHVLPEQPHHCDGSGSGHNNNNTFTSSESTRDFVDDAWFRATGGRTTPYLRIENFSEIGLQLVQRPEVTFQRLSQREPSAAQLAADGGLFDDNNRNTTSRLYPPSAEIDEATLQRLTHKDTRRTETVRSQLEEELQRECTFAPTISRRSRDAAARYSSNPRQEPKIPESVVEKERELIAECTFTPRVNTAVPGYVFTSPQNRPYMYSQTVQRMRSGSRNRRKAFTDTLRDGQFSGTLNSHNTEDVCRAATVPDQSAASIDGSSPQRHRRHSSSSRRGREGYRADTLTWRARSNRQRDHHTPQRRADGSFVF